MCQVSYYYTNCFFLYIYIYNNCQVPERNCRSQVLYYIDSFSVFQTCSIPETECLHCCSAPYRNYCARYHILQTHFECVCPSQYQKETVRVMCHILQIPRFLQFALFSTRNKLFINQEFLPMCWWPEWWMLDKMFLVVILRQYNHPNQTKVWENFPFGCLWPTLTCLDKILVKQCPVTCL